MKHQPPRFPEPLIMLGYAVTSASLLLFTYTQIDLNLTLSRAGFWQGIQKAFQYVGFYQRPLATLLYVLILAALFGLYAAVLGKTRKGHLGESSVWRLILLSTGILVFSYPAAFSYDFFNYLFTAKTVLVYHLNPYTVTPLSLSGIDPWTNFMRWTHLTSAYTPGWILLSLVPYAVGLGYFVLVLFATKFMIAGFYLAACVWLAAALKRYDMPNKAFALAVFALNPVILIETLVSGHNDIVLSAFAVLAVLLAAGHNRAGSWLALGASIAAKLMTIALVPVFLLGLGRVWMLVAMLAALGGVLMRREFLPWYWVWVMPFVALNADRIRVVRASFFISLGLLASYAAYVYFGEYSQIMQAVKTYAIWAGVAAGALAYLAPTGRRNA